MNTPPAIVIVLAALLAPAPDDAQTALALFRARQWQGAADAYGRLVESNPYQGEYWQNYGFALHSLERYEEAIEAFTHSIDAGFRPHTSRYNIACGHALLGHREQALDWLALAYEGGWVPDADLVRTDSDLDSIRDAPRFREITRLAPPEGVSRAEGIAFDLDVFETRLVQLHFHPFNTMTRAQLDEALDRLRSDAGKLSDVEVAFRLQEILTMVGDGHTRMRLHRLPLRRYPVRLDVLSDGLFVVAATPAHADLVGSEVLRIGPSTPEMAIARVRPFLSRDNEMGVRAGAPRAFSIVEAVAFVGLAGADETLPLRLRTPGGDVRTVAIDPGPHTAPEDVEAAAGDGPLPLYLRHRDRPYWMEHLADDGLVYCQINQITDMDDEPMSAFAARVVEFVEVNDVGTLVIDLRHNGGGNSYLNVALVHTIMKCDAINRRGGLYVIAGRHTFSAAQNLATDLEFHTEAIFVGEPTGSRPNFIGETSIVTLPYTGLQLSISSRYHQHSYSNDTRTWIAPEIVAEISSTDLATGRDPALEAILARVRGAGPVGSAR
jgi:hypothetical protein